ncbi:helix-turn-helix domain-containing protein [Streptomyces sp. NPDC014733]|uniref:helix-turn-helix domain-containing protein n=1 Tax=Streptomyces sp. NPDC014733 TaxID=3364885 RepID=UPI0036F75983
MARPETPLPEDAPQPLRELAQGLRDLKAAAQLSYHAMGERSRLSPASLSRAASGRQAPTEEVLFAFLKACAVPADEFHAWRKRLRDAQDASQLVPQPWPIDARIANMAVSGRFHELYAAAGYPSVRMVSERSGIPRSTVHRVLLAYVEAHRHRRTTLPPPGHTLGVASTLLDFLPPSEYGRNGQFADVYKFVRRTYPVRRRARRPLEGGVRRALANAQAEPPPAEPGPEETFAEFERNLRLVRNLIAHGQLKTDPLVAAQVMNLAALLEQTDPDHLSDGPAPGGTAGA